MKSKFLQVRKMLLVAAALLVGGVSSVQAGTIETTLVHTSSSYSEGISNVFKSVVDSVYAHVNNATASNGQWIGFAYADFTFTKPTEAIVKATLTFTGKGESRNTRNCDVMYVNAGESLDYSESGLGSGTAKVDLAATKIESVTFPQGADATTKFTVDVTDAVKTIVEADQEYIIFKFTNNPGGGDVLGKTSEAAPTLVIETADASSLTSYTIKFVDGQSETLKTETIEGVLIGEKVKAADDYLEAFKSEDGTKKYIYVSGNNEITLQEDAESNVITLVFREAGVWSYTINAKAGNEVVSEIAAGTEFEGETVSYYFPYYVLSGSDLYVGPKNNSGTYFGGSFTLDSDNKEVPLTYTKNSNITNVVYLKEAEEIETMTPASNNYINIRCSGGRGAYSGTDALITTLEPGNYKLMTASYANNSTTFTFKAGDAEILSHTGSGGFSEAEKEFAVYTATDITVKGGSSNYALDYVLIYKIGDIENIPVTVSEAGFATYVNEGYALDFSESDIEAYTVKVSTKGVATLTKVDAVPAGTPVLLYAEGGATEAIPVTTDAAAIEDNDLVAGTGAAVATTDGAYTNMILNVVDEKIGFYYANGQTVAANRAYLHIATELAPDAASGARMLINFGGETTGIAEVEKAGAENGAIYNLSGQRINKPANGLYIVNGKKVIIK